MSTRHATMYFEDDPETGMIEFRCDFFGPIDLKSHSHNMASQVISFLNEHAETQKQLQLVPADPQDAAELINTPDDGVHP